MTLTHKQQKFVEEYLIDLNATQAAIRAKYSLRTAGRIGQENLQKPVVQKAIQEAIRARSERTGITADRVLEEYAKIAFLDPRTFYNSDGSLKKITELADDAAACLAGMDIILIGEDMQIKKIKFTDKLKALQDIGRHLGLFEKDKVKLPPVPPSVQIILSEDETDES